MNDLQKPKRFIIECTEEQLEDLKEVIDYVINNEQDHFNEWLEENENALTPHIYSMACNAARIEYKEME